MVRALNALGDRMLAALLPTTTASAALCPGRSMGNWSGCHWFCRRFGGGDRTEMIKHCSPAGCQHHCYDCCD